MRSHDKAARRQKGKTLQIVLFLWAVLLLAYSLTLVFFSNFNMGNAIVWLLTAVTWVYAVWHRRIHAWMHGTLPGRVAMVVLAAGTLFTVAMLVFVSVSGYTAPPTGQEKVLIVLGAGLRRDQPSRLLRCRLDKAYAYAAAHPDVLVVTTGGQGRDELVPEGQAMRDYLIEKGLDPARVLAETKSTSTEENFAFARELLRQNGVACDGPIIYVTNAFHCYRGGQYARMAGFDQAHALPAAIPLSSIPPCYLREVLAVLYYWVFRSSESGVMHGFVGLLSLNKRFFYR